MNSFENMDEQTKAEIFLDSVSVINYDKFAAMAQAYVEACEFDPEWDEVED